MFQGTNAAVRPLAGDAKVVVVNHGDGRLQGVRDYGYQELVLVRNGELVEDEKRIIKQGCMSVVWLIPLNFCNRAGGHIVKHLLNAPVIQELPCIMVNGKLRVSGASGVIVASDDVQRVDQAIEGGAEVVDAISDDGPPVWGWLPQYFDVDRISSLLDAVIADESVRLTFHEPLNKRLKCSEMFVRTVEF
jgi:hypothetical protein